MVANSTEQTLDTLYLRSQLSEMVRLPPWIENLAARHDIPENIQFAIDLCLEEVVSNVIRHGYAGAPDRIVTVHFAMPRSHYFEFVVEDDAPHFNPLAAPGLEALGPEQSIRIGGQGIRLLRQFADSVEYESTASGNRLRMGFSVPA